MFRNLSQNGIIEDLFIYCAEKSCIFKDESYEPSLVFNEFHEYYWYGDITDDKTVHNMLKAITKAVMPKISDFTLICSRSTLNEEHTTDLLASDMDLDVPSCEFNMGFY